MNNVSSLPKGGHAPGHLRDALYDWLNEWYQGESDEPVVTTVEIDGTEKPLRWLIGRLWNCTDCLPAEVRDLIHDGTGGEVSAWTVAQAARWLHTM